MKGVKMNLEEMKTAFSKTYLNPLQENYLQGTIHDQPTKRQKATYKKKREFEIYMNKLGRGPNSMPSSPNSLSVSKSMPYLPTDPIHPVYTSPFCAHLVLNHNKQVFQTIEQNLMDEERERYDNVLKDAKSMRIKVNAMPKIRKHAVKKDLEYSLPIQRSVGNNKLLSLPAAVSKVAPSPTAGTVAIPQKKKKQSQIMATKIETNQVVWKKIENQKWRPEAREGATLTTVQGKAYLFGGMGRDLYYQIAGLNKSLTKKIVKVSYDWNMIEAEGDIPKGRYGHTATVFKRNIILFGGGRKYSTSSKRTECLNDMVFFNTESLEFMQYQTGGHYIPMRRNHSSFLIGKHFCVYGGINEEGKHLDDMYSLNLQGLSNPPSLKWMQAQYKGAHPGKLAFQGCVTVIYKERIAHQVTSLFRIPDVKIPNKHQGKIKEEGIYFFGGKDEQNEISGELRILKIGKKPNEFYKPQTIGVPPEARYGHSMNMYYEGFILIIFGGRNEGGISLNDIHILNLETMCWNNVSVSRYRNYKPDGRYGHSAAVLDSKLIIFGGLNMKTYCKSQIAMLELNQDYAKEFMKQKVTIEAEERSKGLHWEEDYHGGAANWMDKDETDDEEEVGENKRNVTTPSEEGEEVPPPIGTLPNLKLSMRNLSQLPDSTGRIAEEFTDDGN